MKLNEFIKAKDINGSYLEVLRLKEQMMKDTAKENDTTRATFQISNLWLDYLPEDRVYSFIDEILNAMDEKIKHLEKEFQDL